MARIKSFDTPLIEITLRRYERPYALGKRDLVRKLCLSLGLLNPGDSRDIIVDILYVLLVCRQQRKRQTSEEIRSEVIALRKSSKMDLSGTASSNIRRQLKRLRQLFLVEKIKNDYRITEDERLTVIFDAKIEKVLIPSIIERLKDYFNEIEKEFGQ
jgi:hypothetical protein